MPDILTPIQVSLGFSLADLTGRNTVRIGIGGVYTNESFGLPAAGSYYWNDRSSGLGNMGVVFLSLLNAAEVSLSTGETWTRSVDDKGGVSVLGYETYTRSASANVEVVWTNPNTTAVPRWFGFDGADISFTGTTLATPWQSGRLWLPGDRFPARFEGLDIKAGQTEFNEFVGSVVRYGHGGYRLHNLVLERLPGLFVYSDRASHESYLGARPGVAVGDENVSWERGLWQDLYSTSAPVRIAPDRDAPLVFTEAQVWRGEELDDLRQVFEEEARSPQKYRCEMLFVEGS